MTNEDEMNGWKNDSLSRTVIECIIRVHQVLGPGFLESVYRNALGVELQRHDLEFEMEKDVRVDYEGVEVGKHRIDLIVAGRLIVELKAVEELSRAHYAQARSYLKATNLRVALLVNFSKTFADYRRVEAA